MYTYRSINLFVGLQVGDRVRVVAGPYLSNTGMVLQVGANDQCLVISDTTKQELKVFGRWVGGGMSEMSD